jgi:hypothetical protein
VSGEQGLSVGTDVNIYEILNGNLEHFAAFIDNWQDGRPAFAGEVFDALLGDSGIDQQLVDILQTLRANFIEQATTDDSVYCDPEGAFRRALNLILIKAQTWYPVPGRAGQEFPEKIASIWQAHQQNVTELPQALEQYFDKDARRSALAEQRLCESESGIIRQASASDAVLSLYQTNLPKCLLSEPISEFLQSDCLRELQFLRLNIAQYSKEWNYWQLCIEEIGAIFDPGLITSQAEVISRVQSLLNLLEAPYAAKVFDEQKYQQFLDDLSSALFKRMKGDFESEETFSAYANLAAESVSATVISQAIAKKAKRLKVGDWFLFRAENGPLIRCKLALKPEDTDQLLFVNCHGRKVMLKDSETFLLCLSTGVAKPLTWGSPFELALTRTINQRRVELEKGVDEQREIEHQEVANQEAALLQLAADKAQDEARELEARGFLSRDLSSLSDVDASSIEAAEEALSLLRVGAWIEILDEQKVPIRCKLAVIIRGADKYIFTDRLGAKLADLGRDELLLKFCNGQVVVHGAGENFEDQLAKVIRGLRKV